MPIKSLILIIIILSIPLILISMSSSKDIRSKAAVDEIKIFNTPSVTNITPTQATINFVTTNKTTTLVAYDTSPNSLTNFSAPEMGKWRIHNDNKLDTIHTQVVMGLKSNTTYYLKVSGMNPNNNQFITPSDIFSFTTLNVDCSKSDVNKDGKIDLLDAKLIQEGKSFDLNNDGSVDLKDLNIVTNCF